MLLTPFRKHWQILLFTLLGIFFSDCSFSSSKSCTNCKIGIDSSFFPLDVAGQEKNVYGFTEELLNLICTQNNRSFSYVSLNWDTILSSLKEKRVDLVVSTLKPYIFYKEEFEFSDLFLETGPILVVRSKATFSSLSDLEGKIVGILAGSDNTLILEQYPQITITTFNTIVELLDALVKDTIDGVLLDVLIASAFYRDLYLKQIKLIPPKLTDSGLRMMSIKGKNEAFLSEFNKTLLEMKKSGKLEELCLKWGLMSAYPN